VTSPAPARTLRAAFLTPRSFGLLALALVLAAAFAALGQWQISRAIEQGTVVVRPTERIVPLTKVAEPARQQTDASIGQRVETRGRLVPVDTVIVGDRLNDGHRGWWVVGHAELDDPAGSQLAVALGWAPTEEAARAALATAKAAPASDVPLVGRYVDTDAAEPSTSGDPNRLSSVSTARLVNIWTQDVGAPTFEGILTLEAAPAGLDDIYSPKPGGTVELNLLNILYSVEWAIFAVAAFYVWYRLVRDRWEQDQAVDVAEDELDPDLVHHDV
jgi:surfeit locus 1 family protein